MTATLSRSAGFPCCRKARNSRRLTGKTTYIGSWLTIVVKTPLSGETTFPFVTLVRLIFPVMGDRMSV